MIFLHKFSYFCNSGSIVQKNTQKKKIYKHTIKNVKTKVTHEREREREREREIQITHSVNLQKLHLLSTVDLKAM